MTVACVACLSLLTAPPKGQEIKKKPTNMPFGLEPTPCLVLVCLNKIVLSQSVSAQNVLQLSSDLFFTIKKTSSC